MVYTGGFQFLLILDDASTILQHLLQSIKSTDEMHDVTVQSTAFGKFIFNNLHEICDSTSS